MSVPAKHEVSTAAYSVLCINVAIQANIDRPCSFMSLHAKHLV